MEYDDTTEGRIVGTSTPIESAEETRRTHGEPGEEPAGKIVLRDLSKVFYTNDGPVVAVDDVSVSIPKGHFFTIVGPSGCGKTTILRILGGLEGPTSGDVDVQHEDPSKPINSMVFQGDSLLPWMTVRRNVSYGLRMRGVRGSQCDDIVDYYLETTGLTAFADTYPDKLSGGMKQRASIARAFANDPEILLMDEPFSSLDEQNKFLLHEELLRIWEETAKTVVFITHSVDEALTLGDSVFVMTAHPGRKKSHLDVPFARPREILSLRASQAYAEASLKIWGELREEVERAKQRESGSHDGS